MRRAYKTLTNIIVSSIIMLRVAVVIYCRVENKAESAAAKASGNLTVK